MPNYQFRCRSCGGTFEVSRPMARSGDPATCPEGHADTVKLLTTFGTVGSQGGPAPVPAAPSGGGCCGGGCCG